MVSGLWAPSSDVTKSDFVAHCRLAELLSVPGLLLFLKDCAGEYKSTPPQYEPKGIWSSVHQLLTGAVIGFGRDGLSILGSRKAAMQMVKDIPANVKQVLMLAPILSHHLVDASQAMEPLKVAPEVDQVVTEPPPKPHAAKPPAASTVAKQSFAPQQTTSQAGSSRGGTNLRLQR